MWETWSSRFNWVQRAAAYDAHLDEVRLNAVEGRVARAAEKHAKAAEVLRIIRRQIIS